MNYKFLLKSLFHSLGFDVRKYSKDGFGYSITDDAMVLIKSFCKDSEPVIFDVGANVGQSVKQFKTWFKESQITAFEPSKATFDMLSQNTKLYNKINLVNNGVGSKAKKMILYENEQSDISSFLEPTEKLWGKVISENAIEIITLDDYVDIRGIEKIDFLKIDTQGYDFEVVKGCTKIFQNKLVKLVQMEITFDDIYKDLPRIDTILSFMLENNFKIFGFYGFHHHNKVARWTDALFINESVLKNG